MNEPIKVGDLVQIVRAKPCGCRNGLGAIFVVSSITTGADGHVCRVCHFVWGQDRGGVSGINGYFDFCIDPKRLKRIPPLDELEGEKRRDEVEA